MLKKMFAATTALIMIFSSFAVSYAEEAAEKQYIVRLKTSDVQLMNAAGRFTDIAPTDWFCEAVSIVLDKGIVSGTSDTTFEPDATLTRAMLATMLYRYAGEPTVNYAMNYTDTEDGWYTEAVRWASSIGVVKGFDDNTFRPDEPITREQAAAML
ncbi:MAG: S-layer homology domain-containing protein [Clostridia bacterium]|nr:S-layer homology domain-containing protein [Clostridia bacterium]